MVGGYNGGAEVGLSCGDDIDEDDMVLLDPGFAGRVGHDCEGLLSEALEVRGELRYGIAEELCDIARCK